MKADARSAGRFFDKPDPARPAVLLYGPDAMRIALKRQALVAKLVGPEGESEMRLSRMPASDLRNDAASLGDAMRAQGFFPGQRVVLLEDATDTAAKAIGQTLEDWAPGDAMLVVTAGQLGTGAKGLRKLFEAHPSAMAIAIYADPPKPEEIDAQLASAGLRDIEPDARADIHALGRALDPGDFAQLIEKIFLYAYGSGAAVSPSDVAAVAPASTEAALDDAVDMLAAGTAARIAPQMQRLVAQGATPVSLVLAAARYFRLLHAAATARGGPESALQGARPAMFGPRRARFMENLRGWRPDRLEAALLTLTDTDLALRSSRPIPAHALVERAFVRIAMLRKP